MNDVIAKEKAKQQFDYWTDKLGLVHTFDFDEVYDLLMERRIEKQKRDVFRKQIVAFEEKIKNLPGVLGEDPFPLVHKFADGMYVRQLTVPAKTLTVTKIHAQTHPFFLLKGTISILTESGVKTFTAPYSGITPAGTKRIIWHHDEVVFTTVHRTEKFELKEIEQEIIAKDFCNLQDKIEETRIREFVDLMIKQGEQPCLG